MEGTGIQTSSLIQEYCFNYYDTVLIMTPYYLNRQLLENILKYIETRNKTLL